MAVDCPRDAAKEEEKEINCATLQPLKISEKETENSHPILLRTQSTECDANAIFATSDVTEQLALYCFILDTWSAIDSR